ncbi:hypothetical protein EON63_21010 [archaeon]|nr:MAG: hypothetical protein EON63_21010 [archaeon]
MAYTMVVIIAYGGNDCDNGGYGCGYGYGLIQVICFHAKHKTHLPILWVVLRQTHRSGVGQVLLQYTQLPV